MHDAHPLETYIPPFLFKAAREFKVDLKFCRDEKRKLVLPTRNLEGEGRGKRCFLLATGPSLKLETLAGLKGEDCFSLSNFILHPDLQLIAPKYHFFAPWHPPLIKDNFIAWWREAHQKLPSSTSIVLSVDSAAMVREHNLFVGRNVYYIYTSYKYTPHRAIDLCRPILAPQSGPLMALPVLIAMGYKKIYLLGCDHTVMRDFRKHITNFYSNSEDPRKNATDPNSWVPIIDAYRCELLLMEQYAYYREIVNKFHPGIEIVNLSRDSWLDLFSRDTLDHVLKN